MSIDVRAASRQSTHHNDTRHNGDVPVGMSSGLATGGGMHPITAAVQIMGPNIPQSPYSRVGNYEPWQNELWDFYESLGEYNYGVEWFSEALSRCRLNVAELTPGGDEPEVLTDGAAVDIIQQLAGGTDGQSALLRSFGTQLSVPGECYLVGHNVNQVDYEPYGDILLDVEPDANGYAWTVQPSGTMRREGNALTNTMRRIIGRETQRGWKIQVDDARWVPLTDDSLVCRVWDRNERFPWRATSPGRGALATMREIDMYNRYIMATLISRVALNGVWLIPEEVVFPVNPAYEKSQDPFFAELLDIMRAVIKNPGSAASAAPLPLRVPADMVDKFKHLTFATPLDDKIFEAREGAIRRLAASINLPQEVLTGLGSTNHWNAASLEESAIKIHISPKAEVTTRCLSVGYLYPMLRAMNEPLTGPHGGRVIVWYDTSQLTQRPDRSQLALDLNDRIIISDEATRRETGFMEADAPSDKQRDAQLQRKMVITGGQTAGAAYEKLTGEPLSDQPLGGMPGVGAPVPGAPPPNSGPGGGGVGTPSGSANTPGTGQSTYKPDVRSKNQPATRKTEQPTPV